MMCEICAGRKHSSASPSQCPGGQGHPAQHRANAFLSLAEVGSQPRVCRGHMWPPGAEQVKAEGTQTWPQPHHPSLATAVGCSTHHPHLGEVHQAILSVVRGALLDERQVCQVHAQVGDTRRVTTSGANQKEMRNNKKTTKKKQQKLSHFGARGRAGEKGAVLQVAELEGFSLTQEGSPREGCWASSPAVQQDKQELWLCPSQSHGVQEMS